MDVESGESTSKLLGEVDPKHGKKGNPSMGGLGGSNSLGIGGARMVRAKSVVSLVIAYLNIVLVWLASKLKIVYH